MASEVGVFIFGDRLVSFVDFFAGFTLSSEFKICMVRYLILICIRRCH